MRRRFMRIRAGYALIVLLTVVVSLMAAHVIDAPSSQPSAEVELQSAFEERRDDFWIEASGRVTRLLTDDLEGSRHQRLIVRLETGQTLLIAHNIDLAPRLEGIEVGDRLRFRGEYAWNPEGGVIHWTHRDPAGTRPGGWLEWNGRRYR